MSTPSPCGRTAPNRSRGRRRRRADARVDRRDARLQPVVAHLQVGVRRIDEHLRGGRRERLGVVVEQILPRREAERRVAVSVVNRDTSTL